MKNTLLITAFIFVSMGLALPALADSNCVNNRTPTGALCFTVNPVSNPGAGTGASSVPGATANCPFGQSTTNNGLQGGCNLGYTPLEPIPNVTADANGNGVSFPLLLRNIYYIAIVIGALFSVLMLTISGVRYMLSDVVTDKTRARQRIKACIYGLVLIAASWLILNTINPQLVTFTLSPGPVTVNGLPGQNSSGSAFASGNFDVSGAQYQAARDASGCTAVLCYMSSNYLVYDPSQMSNASVQQAINNYSSSCASGVSGSFGNSAKIISGTAVGASGKSVLVCSNWGSGTNTGNPTSGPLDTATPAQI